MAQNSNYKQKKLIIFDWIGTLYDFDERGLFALQDKIN